MTKEQLIRAATYKGNLILNNGYRGRELFDDITHYFNSEMLEIGYTSELINPDVPTLFNPYRVWGQEAINSHLIKRIRRLYHDEHQTENKGN